MFDNLYGYDEENDKEHDYYSFRSHNDIIKQFCPYCGEEYDFLWDRCSNCKNQ